MVCLKLKLNLSLSVSLMIFLGWFAAEAWGGMLSSSRPFLGEKGEGLCPPTISWAPQNPVSLEMEFTVKPSILFAHIIPTIILLNSGCGHKAGGLAKAGRQDIIVSKTKPSKS